jgi:hypothetical protein
VNAQRAIAMKFVAQGKAAMEQIRLQDATAAVEADAARYYADPATFGLREERRLHGRLRALGYTDRAAADILMDVEADVAMGASYVVQTPDGPQQRAGRAPEVLL